MTDQSGSKTERIESRENPERGQPSLVEHSQPETISLPSKEEVLEHLGGNPKGRCLEACLLVLELYPNLKLYRVKVKLRFTVWLWHYFLIDPNRPEIAIAYTREQFGNRRIDYSKREECDWHSIG